jgi:hypothetical protein
VLGELAPTSPSRRRERRWVSVVALALTLSACALISGYDATSYQHATDLKAESLILIEKATDPPAQHQAEIDTLRLKLRQAYEYERGKGKPNAITVQQWELLNDPRGALLGGFLKKWQDENAGQSRAFLQGVAKNVGDAFDQIIKLENGKVKN